jgi:GT2 family glycosyltransferase
MGVTARVWLVVLNWNNSRDTLECLDSVLAARDPACAGVLVCDNASTDACVEQLRAWGARCAPAWVELGSPDRGCRDEPLVVERWKAAIAVAAGKMPIALVHTGANLGYAGGNNVGLRLVLSVAGEEDAALVLNNDTLLTPGCISAMAARLAANPELGMCGATVVYARDGRTIQARAGARFQPWFGRAIKLGTGEQLGDTTSAARVEQQLDFVLGAAVMVTRRLLATVGLMYEGYFLYFEEIDWALRARRSGFRLGYAPDAVLLHKEGGTIGSKHDRSQRSHLADHYLTRGRLLFTIRFFPWYLPTVILFSLAQVARGILLRDWARAGVQLGALCGRKWRA